MGHYGTVSGYHIPCRSAVIARLCKGLPCVSHRRLGRQRAKSTRHRGLSQAIVRLTTHPEPNESNSRQLSMVQQLVLVIVGDIIGALLSLSSTWLWHYLQASDLAARPNEATQDHPEQRFSRQTQLNALAILSDVGIMLLVAAPLQFIFPIIQQDPKEQMTLIMSFDNISFLSTGFTIVGARHTHKITQPDVWTLGCGFNQHRRYSS